MSGTILIDRSRRGLPVQEAAAAIQPLAGGDTLRHGALRAIALLEAAKGCLVLLAALAAASLLHRDLAAAAAALLARVGLRVDGRLATLVLHELARLQGVSGTPLVLGGLAYAALRFVEAFGLWRERAWAQWLGVGSAALYLPFELRHAVHRPGAGAALLLAANLAVVLCLACCLARRQRPRRGGA